jgi:hypothetical protein
MWAGRARRYARRIVPLALEAWRRWQALPPEQRERYLRQAREYAERGRRVVQEQARRRRRRSR